FPLLFPFIFTHAATTELYTLSLHDALPIYWLPALVATAAREAQAGSLSAWSNDGEICSFPRFCEASPVPADPGETQRAAAAATAGALPELPAAAGPAVLLRRQALRQIGDFDAASFQQLVHALADWCRREIART